MNAPLPRPRLSLRELARKLNIEIRIRRGIRPVVELVKAEPKRGTK